MIMFACMFWSVYLDIVVIRQRETISAAVSGMSRKCLISETVHVIGLPNAISGPTAARWST